MNYSCESFMDYVYEEDIVMESVISSIKERLKKICAYLYRRCNELYERNKQKHPKIASVFKRLAEFFKRHSNVVERAQSKEEVQQATQEVEKAKQTMENAEKKVTPDSNPTKDDPRSKVLYRIYDKSGNLIKEFDNEKDYNDYKKEEREKNKREADDWCYANMKKLIDANDRTGIKYIFLDSLEVDPTPEFPEFIKEYNLAKKCGMFDDHKELTPLINDPSKWDLKYYIRLKLDFKKNPSIKRFEHMRKVVTVTHADKIKRLHRERDSKR